MNFQVHESTQKPVQATVPPGQQLQVHLWLQGSFWDSARTCKAASATVHKVTRQVLQQWANLWTGAVVIQAAVGDMVYHPIGMKQVMREDPIKVLCRQATCDRPKLTKPLVLLYKAGPAQDVCPKVCVTPA